MALALTAWSWQSPIMVDRLLEYLDVRIFMIHRAARVSSAHLPALHKFLRDTLEEILL